MGNLDAGELPSTDCTDCCSCNSLSLNFKLSGKCLFYPHIEQNKLLSTETFSLNFFFNFCTGFCWCTVIFFITADTGLCFVFVLETVLINTFQLLLDTRVKVLPHSTSEESGGAQGVGKGHMGCLTHTDQSDIPNSTHKFSHFSDSLTDPAGVGVSKWLYDAQLPAGMNLHLLPSHLNLALLFKLSPGQHLLS